MLRLIEGLITFRGVLDVVILKGFVLLSTAAGTVVLSGSQHCLHMGITSGTLMLMLAFIPRDCFNWPGVWPVSGFFKAL